MFLQLKSGGELFVRQAPAKHGLLPTLRLGFASNSHRHRQGLSQSTAESMTIQSGQEHLASSQLTLPLQAEVLLIHNRHKADYENDGEATERPNEHGIYTSHFMGPSRESRHTDRGGKPAFSTLPRLET